MLLSASVFPTWLLRALFNIVSSLEAVVAHFGLSGQDVGIFRGGFVFSTILGEVTSPTEDAPR